ncbi:MAG: hypothetical protein ACR2KQ_06830 [Actinomycetota bacterium]
MRKRLLSTVLAVVMAAGVLAALPATAQEAERAPDQDPFACGELYTDPAGDVDEENLDLLRGGVAAQDDSSFTASIQVQNLTTDVPLDATSLVWYFRWTSGDVNYFASARYSMWTDAVTYNLGTQTDTGFSTIGPTEGTFTEGEEGTITILVPFEEVGAPASGDALTQTFAESRVGLSGPAGPGFVSAIDRAPDGTAFGTDITVAPCAPGDGEAGPDESEKPKKEKCKKYKKKKKRKACKKRNKKAQQGSEDPGSPEDPETPEEPSGDVCPAYEPGESGAGAETSVVTDEATAEAPLEIIVPTEAGLPVAPTEVFQNIQVDTENENAGLYVRIEFFDDEDLDLYLKYPDDSVAAQAAGFNPVSFIPTNPVFNTNGEGKGGHSEMGAEQVDGVLTPDCGGYTAQFDEYQGFGGERVVKLWLGDATWDPEAQAPIE